MADINSNLPVNDTADGTTGSAVPSIATQVAGSDGTNLHAISTDSTGKVNINNISGTVSLPTGAATASNQTTLGSQTTKINDGTNTMAVKAASTAAAAADPSAVVALSPNSPLPAGTAVIGALSANQSVNVAQFGGTNTVTGTGASGSGIPRVTVSNDSNVLATQSGTWTVQQGTPPWSVVGNIASGSADSGNPVKVGGVFNSSLPSLSSGQRVDRQTDVNGRELVANSPLDGYKATYSASILGLVVATTPTDIFTIAGSATKTIRITRISISGNQNTSASRDIALIKRSAANTGGTFTNPTAVPHDSTDAAATATINAYTVDPTSLGAAVGTIRTKKFQLLATNVTNPLDSIEWLFGNRPSQAVVLRGTSQLLCINLNSVTSSNNSFDIDIEWTEE